MMRGLLYKDLKTLQVSFLLLSGLFVAMLISYSQNSNRVGSLSMMMILPIFFPFCVYGTLVQDQQEEQIPYLLTLPYTRKMIVQEKYILLCIVLGFGIVFGVVTLLVTGEWQRLLLTILASMLGILLQEILLPLGFLLGAQKAKLILLIFCGLVGGVTGSVVGFQEGFSDGYQSVTGKQTALFASQEIYVILLLAILACALLTPLSIFLSQKWMTKKEY